MADDKSPQDAIFRIVINADIQRVWRELTKTDEAQGAIFNAWLHTTGLRPGGRMQMRTGSGKHVLVVGEILEVDPPHRFVHSHRFTQYDDPVCQVAYELKPVAAGVEVTHAHQWHGGRNAHGEEHAAGRRHDTEVAEGHRRDGSPSIGNTRHVRRLRVDGIRSAQTHSQRKLAAVNTTDLRRR